MQKLTGISFDSREVKEGFLFVAINGENSDGHDHIKDAISKGAKVIIGKKDKSELNIPEGIEYLKVKDSREALGEYSSKFYGEPSKKLKIIGVTGTKGKTTTAHLIQHILSVCGKKAGLISSITSAGFHVTSPDAISLHRSLAEMVKEGKEFAVIEVSSHGIDQKRIAGVKFDAGVLTNIAPEHLDYHKTFKEYKRIKMSFVNSAKYKVIAPKTTTLEVLPGVYNNLNLEAAIETVIKFGIKREEALEAAKSFVLPEGRLMEINNNRGFKVFIDFAHTPDSLSAVLTHLKTVTNGRLISVFGCAGERDPRKRFPMGKISAGLSDITVLTAEDPRSEDIHKILSKMAQGAKRAGGIEGKNFFRIPERGEAIAFALSLAKEDDVVAFLGKGHEQSMAYSGWEHQWSDRETVESLLKPMNDTSVVILAAGKGTRMKSQSPKVLRKICGRPMISYTLENLRKAGISDITMVVSFRKKLVMKEVGQGVRFAYQANPKGGTADAAKTGFEKVTAKSETLVVLNGDDSGFYRPETIKKVIQIHKERERKLTFVSLIKENPTGLGRVIRGLNGLITKIVEEKDTNEAERKIKEVNDGFYVFNRDWFMENIGKVKKGPQGEYYLVDLIKLAIDQGDRMATYTLPNDDEWQGVNTPEQLVEAEAKMEARLK